MALNKHVVIPSDKELTVTEVKLSSIVLRAGAMLLGRHCENYNNEFMLCRKETEDPSACIKEGKAVTNCTLNFFRLVKAKCNNEFERYYRCIDRSSSSYKFAPCRKTQAAFDNCMLQNYSIERPEYGYFCRAKVHKTNRPKPPEEEILVFKAVDLPQKLPDDYKYRPDAKYSGRNIIGS